MATTYVIYNGAMPTTAPLAPVTTSATLFTLMQIVPSANTPAKIIEWGLSFNGSALAAGFQCELVETGTVAATVTSYAAADLMPYSDPNAPANTTAGTTSVPLNMSTALSGFTSSAEGSSTVNRTFDSQIVQPAGQYWKQFPLGREPGVLPGRVCRIRVHGDGTVKCVCYMVVEF